MRRLALVVALVVALLVAACSPGVAPPPDVGAVRRGDLDAMVAFLETTHPEPFGTIDETRWRADVAAVRARAGELTADEWLVAVARLSNLGRRNGHGGVFPTDQPGLAMWPVRLYEFADGWYVVAARDASLAGARVEAIGGRPVADVAAALAPAVPYDNAQTVRARVATYLVTPAFLRGVGRYGPLTIVDAAGRRRDVMPEERPPAEYAALAGLDVAQIPPALPRPAYAPRDEWFWMAPRGEALVVGYERVASETQDGTRVEGLVADIEAALRTRRPKALVVDVRRNPGGEVGSARPLIVLLRDVARAGRVPVRVLVGRGTYSATPLAFLDLRREAPSVRFYGEPSSGGSRAFGNPGSLTLPGTGIVVQVGGARAFGQGHEVTAIEPDVPVDVTWAAFSAGRDEVQEAAVR